MTCTKRLSDPPLTPARRLSGLRPYRPSVRTSSSTLLLDANEGLPPVDVMADWMSNRPMDSLCRYPDATSLEATIGRRWNIDPVRVLVTNGGDDAIDRLCRAVLEPGRTAVLHSPTFEMISQSVQLAGGAVQQVEWFEGAFPVQKITDSMNAATRLVALVSPNNPTGAVIPVNEIRVVAERARQVGAIVLLDLAYVEFASIDPTVDLLDMDNVVIIRTFSKAYGLAGLRVGYAIAPRQISTWMRTVGGPYPVASTSLAIAHSVFVNSDRCQSFVERVRIQREQLMQQLREYGARPLPSEANFILCQFANANQVYHRLADAGCFVRQFPSKSQLAGYLRITVPGADTAFAQLQRLLKKVLES